MAKHLGARSIWLHDGDEARGNGGWHDLDGAVAGCQAQHCLRLPIRLHHSDSRRRHLRSQDRNIVRIVTNLKTARADGRRDGCDALNYMLIRASIFKECPWFTQVPR